MCFHGHLIRPPKSILQLCFRSIAFLRSAVYLSNMAPVATKICQKLFRTIPDISFFDVEKYFSKLRTAVYAPRMAPLGLKLRENAFQMIPDISFFDVEKCLTKMFDKNFRRKIGKLPVSEELWFFGRDRQMRLEKWPPRF